MDASHNTRDDLARNHRLLTILTAAQQRYIEDADPQSIFENLLRDLIELTQSKDGFIAEFVDTRDGARELKTLASTRPDWNPQTPGNVGMKSLFETITSELTILNDAARMVSGATSPRTLMGLPVQFRGSAVAVIGLFNRSDGYDEKLADFLQPLLATLGGLLAACRNDQRRRAAEQALAVIEARSRAVLNTMADGVITLDSNGTVLAINPAVETIFGAPFTALVGRPFAMLLAERLAPVVSELLSEKCSGKPMRELVGRRKSGEEFPLELAVNAMEVGEQMLFVATVRDITARHRYEEEVLAGKTRLVALLANIQAAVIVEDEDRRLVLVNQRYCTLFEIPHPPARLIGVDCTDFAERAMHLFKDPQAFLKRTHEVIEQRNPVIEEELQLADGRVLVRDYVPITIAGEHRGFLWKYGDITGRRRAEDQLRAARDAAEAANRAKSEFLASMSHDLRTPMTAIVGYADLMLRARPLESDRVEWTRQVQRNARYLLALISDILDLSRIEAGQLKLNREAYSIVSILSAIRSMLEPIALEKSLDFQIIIDGPLPVTVDSDPVRIRQVLLNLTDNAIKFTDKGSVSLRARLDAEKSQVIFTVSDTGIGISPEKQALLFRSFTQVHNPSRRAQGSGLGLAISKRLAEILGGGIELESTLGVGSKFTFTLPVSDSELQNTREFSLSLVSEMSAENPCNTAPNLADVQILVVDDNPDNRRIIEALLAETTAHVVLAEDGAQACDRVLARHADGKAFDLILMDMQMPVMDGYAATCAIRKAGVKTPIIAITAFAMAGDEAKCLAAGCDAYLSKPIVPQKFYETVGTWLFRVPASSIEADATDLTTNPAMAAVAEEYVASFPERLQELSKAWQSGDTTKARLIAHRFRGAAANLGLPEVSYAAAEAENAIIAEPASDDAQKAVARLMATLAFFSRKKA